ncbi:MAG: hypothetical protein O7B99_03700 [Planctomycetota bacterium]|nr:hypothetical protein [Planctomycetota bacterium]
MGGPEPLPQDDEPDEQVAEKGAARHFAPIYSRWYAPGAPYMLGDMPIQPSEYDEVNEPAAWWNPYRQNKLKGDFPILGTEDVFLATTFTYRTLFNTRNLPTPTGISGSGAIDPDFFGDGKQDFWRHDVAFTLDFFKGQQGFKPVDWRIKVTPVFNYTDLGVEEVGVVKVDVTEGNTRQEADLTIQEALIEYHLFDLSDRYDFVSSEIGVFPFRSDFRGFIFDDTNLGVRLFGNYDENKWQYNLVYFDMLDKDTNSQLVEYSDRKQDVFIANIYRQDWPVLGFQTSASFHYNHDFRGFHFDDNGFLVSPAPVGLAEPNDVEAYYFGLAGEGHFDRVNVTAALYQVYGEDENNPFAARDVDINAHMGALELSYDVDWYRWRIFAMHSSGDDDMLDDDAEGFDAIFDAPNFAGGEFSFFNSQAIKLLGVNLTNALSPQVDLQTSKFEGKSNFVNPGVNLIGVAWDAEVTPTLRAMIGSTYLRFSETAVLETFLQIPEVEREIGLEFFMGTQWRPLLTQNVILQLGASALVPGDGFERIYQSDETLYSVFFNSILTW